jgi:FkbM family methyltransferase
VAAQKSLIDRLRLILYSARRRILRNVVPEFVWPEYVDIDGVQIRLRGAPYSFGVKRLLRGGQYELPERQIANKVLASGMTVIEMGSSIGILTAVMAKRVGKNGTVVAVEASQELTSHSRTWLEYDGISKVICGYGFPVWEVPPGLLVDRFNSSTGSLGGTLSFSLNPTQSSVTPGEVEVLDLRTLCERFALTPDILVVDVEGSERLLMLCEPRLPLTIRHLLIELHPGLYEGGVEDMELIVKSIRAEGFELREMIGGVHYFQRPE